MTGTETGIGPQLDRAAQGVDPRGVLVFHWLPDDLQRQEDSRQAADRERLEPRGFTRDATPAERLLLEHLGHTLPDDLQTAVRWVTPGVRNRSWPQLETQEVPAP